LVSFRGSSIECFAFRAVGFLFDLVGVAARRPGSCAKEGEKRKDTHQPQKKKADCFLVLIFFKYLSFCGRQAGYQKSDIQKPSEKV